MIVTIGLDVAKEKIDFYSEGLYGQILNDENSIKNHFKKINRKTRIVMESTGKYHRIAHRALEAMGFEVMVINPYQSKHFAKAMNLLCKTDKVDAKMLSMFGDRMVWKATPCKNMKQEDMQELSRHLDDLKKLKVDFELRNRDSSGFVKRSLEDLIASVNKKIKKVEEALAQRVTEEESLKRRLEILKSIPGIGQTTGIMLLCYLEELGQLNKREIAALSGLAPMNNDSGKFKGKRRIRGGRFDVRSSLYMPTLGAATQYNKRLNKFYIRLVDNGKPKKVALTACMRKLIVWANSLLSTDQTWNEIK